MYEPNVMPSALFHYVELFMCLAIFVNSTSHLALECDRTGDVKNPTFIREGENMQEYVRN